MQQVILASSSKQRKAFLELFSIPFITIPANLDEKTIQDHDLAVRVEKLARAKAEKNPVFLLLYAVLLNIRIVFFQCFCKM
jgi:predicted house-cleaning NTP pyrophosphatase (Maf/HAM1 superfamily)